jgi:hypothetical protein
MHLATGSATTPGHARCCQQAGRIAIFGPRRRRLAGPRGGEGAGVGAHPREGLGADGEFGERGGRACGEGGCFRSIIRQEGRDAGAELQRFELGQLRGDEVEGVADDGEGRVDAGRGGEDFVEVRDAGVGRREREEGLDESCRGDRRVAFGGLGGCHCGKAELVFGSLCED